MNVNDVPFSQMDAHQESLYLAWSSSSGSLMNRDLDRKKAIVHL